MINSMNLYNFKSFKSLENFVIKPITVLSGTNSSGKSSILQSLLLLKQSLNKDPTDEALILSGDYVQHANIKELAYNLPQENSASISYEFHLIDPTKKKSIGDIYFEFRNKYIMSNPKRKGTVVNKLKWKEASDTKYLTSKIIKGAHLAPKQLQIDLPYLEEDMQLKNEQYIKFCNFLPEYISGTIQHKNKNKHGGVYLPLDVIKDPLNNLVKALSNELNKMKYLGPTRALPKPAYVYYTTKDFDLDEVGSNTAQVFWLRQNEYVSFLGRTITLKEGVNECLSLIGFNQRVRPVRQSNIVYKLLIDTFSSTRDKVTIADVGFGYSQILPIIIRGLLSEENALLLFEQPEIHLHPSAKAKLASVFLAFAKSNKRMLIETHSTELINALQLEVIKNPELKDEINVGFVEMDQSHETISSTIRQLSLRSDGMFNEWPQGFCDESEKLSQAMLEESVKRGI